MERSLDTFDLFDWIKYHVSQTEPASTAGITDRCPPDRILGKQSENELRMKAFARKVRNGTFTDPRISNKRAKEVLLEVLEKMILFDKRVTLGEAAAGVDRFKTYADGEVGEYVKIEKPVAR